MPVHIPLGDFDMIGNERSPAALDDRSDIAPEQSSLSSAFEFSDLDLLAAGPVNADVQKLFEHDRNSD